MVNRIIIILYKILRKIIILFGVPLHFSSDGEDFILQMKKALGLKNLRQGFTAAIAGDVWDEGNPLFATNML